MTDTQLIDALAAAVQMRFNEITLRTDIRSGVVLEEKKPGVVVKVCCRNASLRTILETWVEQGQ